jgi:hypothetical protein
MSKISFKIIFRSLFFFVILFCLSFIFTKTAQAVTYYIATTGNDTNQGTISAPFRTVQKGINSAADGDTVYINSGTYDMAGFTTSLSRNISLLGQDKNTTILRNGGTITFHRGLSVKNLTFENHSGTVFHPLASSGETIDGVYLSRTR